KGLSLLTKRRNDGIKLILNRHGVGELFLGGGTEQAALVRVVVPQGRTEFDEALFGLSEDTRFGGNGIRHRLLLPARGPADVVEGLDLVLRLLGHARPS